MLEYIKNILYLDNSKCFKIYGNGETCDGVIGGDKYTNYLHYSCISCPYFTPVKENAYGNNNN